MLAKVVEETVDRSAARVVAAFYRVPTQVVDHPRPRAEKAQAKPPIDSPADGPADVPDDSPAKTPVDAAAEVKAEPAAIEAKAAGPVIFDYEVLWPTGPQLLGFMLHFGI